MKAFEQLSLPLAETKRLNSYGYDKKWVASAIFRLQAHLYVKLYLEEVSSDVRKKNCTEEGDVVYRRKDGRLISQADVDAVDALDMGQTNTATMSPNGVTLLHHWLCDSGD